ncbi:MAG TPA: type II toxin-antitoxin system RelE/ParE family toxin [Rhizomicrobium sp.]
MISVIFSHQANQDLEDIGDFIAQDSALQAKAVVTELRRRAHNIANAPRAYPSRSDLGTEMRAMIWRPYLVLFRVVAAHVEIVHIVHGARDLNRLFARD